MVSFRAGDLVRIGKVEGTIAGDPKTKTLCGELYTSQKSQEKQISGLRNFARRVEQFLTQLRSGAVAPREPTDTQDREGESSESFGFVPGAPASSSSIPTSLRQSPTPPRTPTTQTHSQARAVAPRKSPATPNRRGGSGEPPEYVPGASVPSPAMSANMPTPTPPTFPAPPIPTEVTPSAREAAPTSPRRGSPTRFSTVRSEVLSGAIRIDIANPEQWAAGDVAVIRNQEAKKVRDIGSLIFDTPIQHDYEAGVEVRSLLPTEQLEEIDGRLAVLDVDPVSGTQFVKFWVDEVPLSTSDEGLSQRRERTNPVCGPIGRDTERRSPDFGGGVDYQEFDSPNRERLPPGGGSPNVRERVPNAEGSAPIRVSYPRTPPEDQVPKGCSLHSMEPLREWFCKGAARTSAAEEEAALVQLEDEPPDIRQYNVNIREERWTNFSLEGVRFPAMTVDVIQRGEALAIFERDLIIHFQQISKAAALYVRALLGGVKRALEVYRRVDETTKNFPWSLPTTEEKWHAHAEGVLMVALTTLNLPTEAWKKRKTLESSS